MQAQADSVWLSVYNTSITTDSIRLVIGSWPSPEHAQFTLSIVGYDEPPKKVVKFYIENDSLKFKSDYPMTAMCDSLRENLNRNWTAHAACKERYENLKVYAVTTTVALSLLLVAFGVVIIVKQKLMSKET